MNITELTREMYELLSEYGVDRAGVDAAISLALDYGEREYEKGYDYAEAQCPAQP